MRSLPWREPDGWPSDAARERIIGDWYLYQRRGGHRTSTDDVLTAWMATMRHRGVPRAYLDLGCGVASVLLMTAHRLRPSTSLGIEAQAQSVAMARRSLEELPCERRVARIVHSDFRDFDPGNARFDLITGSPPYFPLGTGSLPADAQRRACRFEARGGVEAYCEIAARCLSSEGRFYFVFQSTWDARVQAALRSAGLVLSARLDAKMRVDRDQDFLTVYEASLRRTTPRPEAFGVAIRDQNGAITPGYTRARRELGLE